MQASLSRLVFVKPFRTFKSRRSLSFSSVPWGDPMLPVLCLATLQIGMGAFDNIYHHELTERLPWRPSQAQEQFIHSIRGALYTGVFASFAGVTPHGAWAGAMVGILVVETGITLWDNATEDRTRQLPWTERTVHTLMTLNYGALLACWVPLLVGWGPLPTELVFQNYGLFSVLNAACAGGVGLWAIRDWRASARLQRFAKETLPVLGLQAPRQKILVTGSTGLLGSRLVRCLLAENHEVTIVVRDTAKAARMLGGLGSKLSIVTSFRDFPDPVNEYFDVVINLAGESIAAQAWSEQRKAALMDSRVNMTLQLNSFLDGLRQKPRVIIAGSAIGFYGVDIPADADSVRVLSESDPPSETTSFSHALVAKWEETSQRAAKLGPRVVLLRTGVVLSRDGGALAPMLTPFELGLGGPTGSGTQMMPWIHIDDWIRVVGKCVDDALLRGPVNVTAPQPVSNRVFAAALGRALHRPAVLPLPLPVLQLALGKQLVYELLETGSAVIPAKLSDAGFTFHYPDIDSALHAVVDGTCI
jgi:uncharacterized protein (TIGR01777 family)